MAQVKQTGKSKGLDDRAKIRLLDIKLDDRTAHSLMILAVIELISVVLHDCDHVRQAINWGYSIPVSLLVLNITVYIFPVVSIFLTKNRRWSATIVTAVGGIFTAASFDILHLFGSFSGLWGIWNDSYFVLGVDWISWVFLAEVTVLCLPCTCLAMYLCGKVTERALKQ